MKGIKKYSNGEITVHWEPDKCQHAGKCVANLPCVFNVKAKPWINISEAPTEDIKRVVDMCPSGALYYSEDNQ